MRPSMNKMEALELALRLAIAAPDQERANQVVLMAEEIAAGMTLEEVATVKEELEFEGRN
jgi:hypothetical protein